MTFLSSYSVLSEGVNRAERYLTPLSAGSKVTVGGLGRERRRVSKIRSTLEACSGSEQLAHKCRVTISLIFS